MCVIYGDYEGYYINVANQTLPHVEFGMLSSFCFAFFIFFDSVITRQDNEYLKFHKPINSCLCERKTFSMMRKKNGERKSPACENHDTKSSLN